MYWKDVDTQKILIGNVGKFKIEMKSCHLQIEGCIHTSTDLNIIFAHGKTIIDMNFITKPKYGVKQNQTYKYKDNTRTRKLIYHKDQIMNQVK